MPTIHNIVAESREAATSNRDLGVRFERLVLEIFKTYPQFTMQFSEVWMWNDFRSRGMNRILGLIWKQNGRMGLAIVRFCASSTRGVWVAVADGFVHVFRHSVYRRYSG